MAVASPAYVFRRKFEMQYKCCPGPNETTVWVDGNYAHYIEYNYDAAYPVHHVALPLPVGGVLGGIADAVGADIPIIDWWDDPKGPDGEQPGVDDSQEPNGRDKLVAAPEAVCGEKITLPGGEVIPWPRQETPTGGGGAGGGTTTDPPPPVWHPRPDWPPAMDDCCTGKSPIPTLAVNLPAPRIYPDGGSWYVDLSLSVTHPCGLKSEPTVTEYLLHNGHPDFNPSPRVKVTPLLDGTGYDLGWKRAQVAPRSEFGGGIRVHINAVSKCEGVLDAVYTVRAKYQAGERIPVRGSGRWQCVATGVVQVLSGGDTLPSCAGDWIWLGT